MKEFNAYANNTGWKLLVLLIAFTPAWLQAEEVATAPDPMSSVVRVALTLVGMIAFIFLLAYFAKRLQGMSRSGGGNFSGQGKMIKTLATISLGLKEKVSLIQVGEQQILIGITSQSIQTLLVLDTPIEAKDIEQQSPAFQAIFNKALNKA
ncbi:MAG TPA: flagellar biosynthetic protein FliO [Oceanospirillales bacterium]|nr:flagellar biosynthetic protein FliO [Oleispira sp.]HCM05908.1 flagellar biosynthetic protein FliO [Oceanospirillales bacterium]